jgi:hypothetical protein
MKAAARTVSQILKSINHNIFNENYFRHNKNGDEVMTADEAQDSPSQTQEYVWWHLSGVDTKQSMLVKLTNPSEELTGLVEREITLVIGIGIHYLRTYVHRDMPGIEPRGTGIGC